MYEYAPVLPKKKERILMLLSLLLGLSLFGFSQIPSIPFSMIYQLLGFLSLLVFIFFVSRYLVRRYVYRIEPRSDGGAGDAPDFVITEHYGRRITVVCRVSVSDIEEILPITQENQTVIKEKQKGCSIYDYTADLFSQNRYLVTIADGEQRFCVRILADKELLKWLKKI